MNRYKYMNIQEKQCSKCGVSKPLTDYHRDSKGREGRRADCKACAKVERTNAAYPSDDKNNVLVIGDLHSPFIKEGYLEFCIAMYKKHNCTEVVFLGDVIDNHFSSYHTSNPDGYSAGEELDRAIDMLAGWYEAFPVANVMLGNHDRIPARKAMDAGLSNQWIKDYSDVLNTPNWQFVDSYLKDDVLYVHGDGASHAAIRSKKDLMNIVQGHFHSKCYVEYTVGRRFKIFGMQAPCGVDDKSYAMAYGKNSPRSAIGCAVILDNGRQPVIEMMEL